jgi:minor extracellular serine protease Vpr
MKRFFLFLACSTLPVFQLAAQPIPGRYIVEFQTEPAASVAAQARIRLSDVAGPGAAQVAARRAQIQAEHAAVEPAIRALGGTVTRRYDTVFNGMSVSINDSAAGLLRSLPGVREVYPDRKHKLFLDHVVKVHHITDAWQSLPNGMAGAGAGIMIGMLDTGIDINHPGFQGFSTPIPQGFPKVSSPAETANTNNKVIVSRDYSGAGGLDQVVGHGTGTSMIAAGLTNAPGPALVAAGIISNPSDVGPITGAAPAAWLGNYRVLDDTGSGSTTWFLAALQDAVNDGMNVVNYSAGGPVTDSGEESGSESRAIDAAVAAGVIVVIAAGNNGPEPDTIGDPGLAPNALTVGSNENERFFGFAVTVASLPPYEAFVPDSEQGIITGPISGPLTDVTALDGNGYGCAGFPANSLSGQIALISRGSPNSTPCTFDAKLTGAQQAGANGAIIYDNMAEDLVDMSITATLPATFVSQASGQDLKTRAAASPGLVASIDFTGSIPFTESSDQLSLFSSIGPTPAAGLKPELLATGDTVFTACTTISANNCLFPTDYQLNAGTSFSAPAVTGSVAVLMGARPGLTAAQYRSLILNGTGPLVNSTGTLITPQAVGAGKLNLLQGLQNNLAAVPPSVNFRTAPGAISSVKPVIFSNVGSSPDTFSVVVNPINSSGPAATVDVATFTLAPGASQTVNVSLTGTGLAAGEYDGFLAVTGTQTSVTTRVPYWFGVPGTAVQYVSLLSCDSFGPSGSGYNVGDSASILIRSTDLIGMPFDAGTPTVTNSGVRGLTSVAPIGNIPGTYQITVRVGRADSNGLNVITITAGGVSNTCSLQLAQ